MKSINILFAVVLAIVVTHENEQTKQEATQQLIQKEVVVEPVKPTADSFCRPRKPCPPSGPGKR